MLKTIGLLVVLAIVVIVVLALAKPATYHVERSVTITATPEKIDPLIENFHNWPAWSPWQHLDPNVRMTYTGASSGAGAIYEWEGNKKVGQGRMEVLSSTPTETTIKLDFLKPFESHNTSTFTLQPQGEITRVTWSMDGPNTFMTKVMSVFSSMDKMIGGDFQDGLANMKTVAEK